MARGRTRRLCYLVVLSVCLWMTFQFSLIDLNRKDYEAEKKSTNPDIQQSEQEKKDITVNDNQPTRYDVPKDKTTSGPETDRIVVNANVAPVVKKGNELGRNQEEKYAVSMREVSDVVEKARKIHELGDYKPNLSEEAVLSYDAHQIDKLVNNIDRLKLFVAILSNHDDKIGRQAIRESWLQQCRGKEIICKFFTDGDETVIRYKGELKQEQEKYNDLELLDTSPGARKSGARMLQIMEMVNTEHAPEYLLLIHTRRFLCVRRLLFDIEFRQPKYMVWGALRCQSKAVRMQDGFLMVSGDLMKMFLSNEASLLCHPYADQQLAIWINSLKSPVTYFDDSSRIYSYQQHKSLQSSSDTSICLKYLSVSGVENDEMTSLWKNSQGDSLESYVVPSVEQRCNQPEFDWTRVCDTLKIKDCHLKAEPKPCKDNPNFPISSD